MLLSEVFMLVFLVSLILLLGWVFLSLFFPRGFDSSIEKMGFSFGLGLGIVTVIEVIFLYLKIKISPLKFVSAIVSIIFALYLFSIKKKYSFPKMKRESLNLVSKIILFFIIIQGVWVVTKAFNLPIISDDAISIWGLKAKTIYFSNLSGDAFTALADKMRYTLSGNYPLLIPLAENYVNLFSGEWNDLYPKIISPLFYFSFLLSFFGLVRRFTDKNYALIFTFFLSSLPFLSDSATDAIADLPFAYYYALSFLLILVWMKNRQNQYLYLCAIFSGLSIWTKNEGYPAFLINLAIIFLFSISNLKFQRKELYKGLGGFMIIIIPVILLVAYYQHLTGIKEGIINSETLSPVRLIQNYKRLPLILYQLQRQLLGTPNKWNLLGHLFIFTLFIRYRRVLRYPYFYILLAIVLNFMLYITVYLLSPHEVGYHIGTSQNRVLMHLVPLMLFFSAVILYQKEARPGT